ncbi:MAG: hypothetical protein ABJ013_03710 [Halioglobus sp.]
MKTKEADHPQFPRESVAIWSESRLTNFAILSSHFILLAILYFQTFSFGYVFYDDWEYLGGNPQILSGFSFDNIKWAFSTLYFYNWHPITWLSYMLDASLFDADPGWAHIHNALLHGLNGLLVYVFLLKLSASRWSAYIMSIIFLVHPLHVESVAWIAERKDLLCAFFFLLGLILYDTYRRLPSRKYYLGILLSYTLALLAKPMAVTFPVVLLMLDFFVYRNDFRLDSSSLKSSILRFNYLKALIEKMPMLALSLASSIITIIAQDDALVSLKLHTIGERWVISTSAYSTYLKQFFAPIDLAAFYPLPLGNTSIIESTSLTGMVTPTLTLVAIGAVALMMFRKFPLVIAGFCFFLITLLPVIGIVQVGGQLHADRYMYIPSIGALIACIYLPTSLNQRFLRLTNALVVIFTMYLTVICYWQVSYWESRYTLFSRVLNVSGPNYVAHMQLGSAYLDLKMSEEARLQFLDAIALAPLNPEPYRGMGNVAILDKDFASAEGLYRMAFERNHPDSVQLYIGFGVSLAEQGKLDLAAEAFEKAISIEPTSVEAKEKLKLYLQNHNQDQSL